MRLQYYDPTLYTSMESFPNTMGIAATLTEPVSGELLREAVEELRVRFPYFYVRVKVEDNELITVENTLPVTVRNTWEPILLNSEEANFHVMAFKYKGNRLAVETSHALTDGAGLLPYFRSVLFCYLSRKTGKEFDTTGFRLPGDVIPETEIGDPFPGLDIDGAGQPMYQKPPIPDFYKVSEYLHASRDEWKLHCLKLPEAEVMRYCHENDGSPNVLMAVLLSRAIRRLDPKGDETIAAAVAIDYKAQLGNHENYRMLALPVTLDFPKKRAGEDIARMCTIARGQLMLQAQPENALFLMNTLKARFEQTKQVPLQVLVDKTRPALGHQRATFCVSYANSRSFGPVDPYISELYILGEPMATDVLCEVACVNHSFFLAFSQTFANESYYEAFLEELKEAGIPFEEMGREDYRLCGCRYDGITEITL